MKSFRLISLPLAAFAMMAMLTGCGNIANPTGLGSSLDTTPPPAPASVFASYDATGPANLLWEASAAPDVIGYQVYVYSPSPDRDNAYVLADDPDNSDTSFLIPSVSGDAEVHYRVRAVDASGNTSAFSAAATVHFQAPSGGGGIDTIIIDPN